MKNPLRNLLTPSEQRILLFLLTVLLMGNVLALLGWTAPVNSATDADSLRKAVKTDVPLRIDIRTASLEELVTLPGIGEKRAADIIAYRGGKPFKSVNQLLEVKGIGTKTYAKLLPDLLVFGDSTNVETKTEKSSRSSSSKAGKASSKPLGMVNINKAGLEELCTLSGIGEVKAKAIIEWRNTNGAFSSIEDITKVKGIGAKTLEKNRDRLRTD